MKNSQATGPDTGGNEAMWQQVEQDKRMAKKQELCVVGLEAAGAGYMRLSHKDVHGPLTVTCAISPAQERRMGLWGSLRHKTQASFSVSLPSRTWSRWHNSTQIHDKGLGGGAGL
jgi:hypothetical protein